jgi:hypothetical protein
MSLRAIFSRPWLSVPLRRCGRRQLSNRIERCGRETQQPFHIARRREERRKQSGQIGLRMHGRKHALHDAPHAFRHQAVMMRRHARRSEQCDGMHLADHPVEAGLKSLPHAAILCKQLQPARQLERKGTLGAGIPYITDQAFEPVPPLFKRGGFDEQCCAALQLALQFCTQGGIRRRASRLRLHQRVNELRFFQQQGHVRATRIDAHCASEVAKQQFPDGDNARVRRACCRSDPWPHTPRMPACAAFLHPVFLRGDRDRRRRSPLRPRYR